MSAVGGHYQLGSEVDMQSGPIFIICAMVRDTVEHHRQLWTAWAVIAFCLTAFLASVPRSITNFGREWEKVIASFHQYIVFFVIAMMIVAFVLVYGEIEIAI
ncbi:unnamed protein product [Strongylus vulgaris]|uniref:Uncharacterized protein n=1 Tax=Strongylus vulgaris TaxID=40348 RepID=A0A3P7ITW0_STRVU|nr:unnamed protein product [Strongylus vulgaris]